MSKALDKSKKMAAEMEKNGKKYLKEGLHDYIGFAIFFFGGIYMGVKSVFAGNYKTAFVCFGVAAVVLSIVFFGKKILIKLGQLKSK